MSQSLKQFGSQHPKIYAATANLRGHPKVRRGVMEQVVKLEASTSVRDLADKVIDALNEHSEFYFGLYKKGAWNLRDSIQRSIEVYNGFTGKNALEVDYLYKQFQASEKHLRTFTKSTDGVPNTILFGNSKDFYRVYITDPQTLVAIVPSMTPSIFLDNGEERNKRMSPRDLTFIKMHDGKCLILFQAFTDNVQRRFIIDGEKCRSLDFQPISTHFEQHGLNIRKRAVSGDEVNTNKFGELVGERRPGKTQHVWIIDVTNRGPVGDVGPKGDKGDTGKTGGTFTGTDASTWAVKCLYDGKRPVLTLSEFEDCVAGNLAKAAIPMNKHFFNFLSDERKRRERDGAAFVERLWTEVVHHG
jgi:hypothetical protein